MDDLEVADHAYVVLEHALEGLPGGADTRAMGVEATIRAYSGAAVVLMVLSACGTDVAPTSTSGPTPVSTPVSMPASARDAVPSAIPSAPAPQAFLDRAHAVAQAVRAAGIPEAPAGIFLLSSRTPGLGFDTTEQKLAWSAGQVVVAPGVQLGSGGASRIDFADGSTLPVSALDAHPALMGVVGTTRSNCRNIPASKCILTITRASATTAQVETSNGPATVPAWSFTAKGLSRRIVVVAVPHDVLKSPVEPVPPPGLAEPAPVLLQVQSLTRIEDSTLTFVLGHRMCHRDLRAHVLESDDMVVIGGSVSEATVDCGGPDVGMSATAVITLSAPLGDRAVISASAGTRLTPPLN
jgi:hypothetical protein